MFPRMFGRYRLEGELGRGGMGVVYRAFDTEKKRYVALKVLPAELSADPTYRARFRRESELAARLNDAHVIPIHDFGEIDGQLFLDMRLVPGSDLDEVLRTESLPPAEAVDVVGQVACALHAAHEENLVHRDVKPSNVLLAHPDADGHRFAYLCDFGVALPVDPDVTRLTASDHLVGTLAYMAPERFTPAEPDRRADVYALACLLFQALTGRPPFPYHEVPALMGAHHYEDPPRPSEEVPELPTAMDDVVARGMAKDPADRFDGAGALARAARAALSARDEPKTPVYRAATTPLEARPGRDPGRTAQNASTTSTPRPVARDDRSSRPDRPPTEQDGPRQRGGWSRLADPWAALLAAAAGGTTFAVLPDSAPAVGLGVGVAVVVFATKAVAEALSGRR